MARGAANMAALSRRVENIPDASVADLVRWFVPRSEEIGGRFRLYGHEMQLSSRIRSRSSRSKMSTTRLAGTPATGWSIKSYGRKGNYDVRPRRAFALHIGGFAEGAFFERVHIDRATSGDGRWDKLVAEADLRFPDVVADLVDGALRF